MIIDMHTHCFPDRICGRVIAGLAEKSGIRPHLDGSAAALRRSTAESGIDRAVVAPIATAPRQQESIFRFACELHGQGNLLSLGSVHPDSPDWEEMLSRIRQAGLPGIKLHPDYQGFFIGEERALRVIDRAHALGLFTLIHAGMDAAYPSDVHCPPEEIIRLLPRLEGKNVILAHLAGYGPGEAEKVLAGICGRDVYLDTAITAALYPDAAGAILRAHRADRLLFGSDSPWGGQREAVAAVRAAGLDPVTEELVLGGNAARLLGLRDFGKSSCIPADGAI